MYAIRSYYAQAQPTAAAQPVQRIVSLDLCTDWPLAYYAAPARVLARSPLALESPLPGEPYHWAVHDGSLEQIYRLAPGRVIVGQYNAGLLRARLQTLGVPVAVLPLPTDLASYNFV